MLTVGAFSHQGKPLPLYDFGLYADYAEGLGINRTALEEEHKSAHHEKLRAKGKATVKSPAMFFTLPGQPNALMEIMQRCVTAALWMSEP